MELHYHFHPLTVHFPIALFITALGSEILSRVFKNETLHKVAYYNYFFGILGGVAAVLAAWLDNEILKHPVFYYHKNLAYITVGFSFFAGAVLVFLKRKSMRIFRTIFLLSLLFTASLVAITAFYGGKLVYEYGVGVEE